ncbi:MAG: phage virion morphogenesis protein [Bacteroidales bacterium]|nr:phage virion morphogenesis protein [Bacteroidales bacterium]
MAEPILKQMMREIAVSLGDLFDKSFETKSFGGKAWPKRILNLKGSLMMQSGALRRSINAKVSGFKITFTSNLPYAKIHNDGGKIKVTAKMKRYFWAMHKQYSKKVKKRKNGTVMKASLKNNELAEFYKAMALKKVGSEITIPQRQFIGNAPEVEIRIKKITDKYIPLAIEEVMNKRKK